MPPRVNIADLAQRATATCLVGLGIWGLWLTAAVWKSRRGDGEISGVLGRSSEIVSRDEEQLRKLEAYYRDKRIDPPPQNPS